MLMFRSIQSTRCSTGYNINILRLTTLSLSTTRSFVSTPFHHQQQQQQQQLHINYNPNRNNGIKSQSLWQPRYFTTNTTTTTTTKDISELKESAIDETTITTTDDIQSETDIAVEPPQRSDENIMKYFDTQFMLEDKLLEEEIISSLASDEIYSYLSTLSPLFVYLVERNCQNANIWKLMIKNTYGLENTQLFYMILNHLNNIELFNEDMCIFILDNYSKHIPKEDVSLMVQRVASSTNNNIALSEGAIKTILTVFRDNIEATELFWNRHRSTIEKINSSDIYNELIATYSRDGDYEMAKDIISKHYNPQPLMYAKQPKANQAYEIVLADMYANKQMDVYQQLYTEIQAKYDFRPRFTLLKTIIQSVEIEDLHRTFSQMAITQGPSTVVPKLANIVIERYIDQKEPVDTIMKFMKMLSQTLQTGYPTFVSNLLCKAIKDSYYPKSFIEQFKSLSSFKHKLAVEPIRVAASVNRFDIIKKLVDIRFPPDCPPFYPPYCTSMDLSLLLKTHFIFGSKKDIMDFISHLNIPIAQHTNKVLPIQLVISHCIPQIYDSAEIIERIPRGDEAYFFGSAVEIALLKDLPNMAQSYLKQIEKRGLRIPFFCYDAFIKYYTMKENQEMVDQWVESKRAFDPLGRGFDKSHENFTCLWEGVYLRYSQKEKKKTILKSLHTMVDQASKINTDE